MDGFELNKVLGALLMSALIVLGIGNFANILYATDTPETPAFGVEVASSAATGSEAAAGPTVVDFGTLLAAADLAKGERTAKGKCASCHTFNKGGPNGTGPNLYGIVGAKVAHLDNFRYSSAMAAKGGAWGYPELYGFLEKPQAYLKGTAMSFAGLSRQNERIDVIAWLNAQSDSPLPLPAPLPTDAAAPSPAGLAPEGMGAPAEGEAAPSDGAMVPADAAPADHGGTHTTGDGH